MQTFSLALLFAAVVVGTDADINTSNSSSDLELPPARPISNEPLDIKLKMIESNRYFDIFKATTTENLSISPHPDFFDVVKIGYRGVNPSLHRFDFIKRIFVFVPEPPRYKEKYEIIGRHKDEFRTGAKLFTPMNNLKRFFAEQMLPDEPDCFVSMTKEGFCSKNKWYVRLNDSDISKTIPFDSDNRALVFYEQKEPQVLISDHRGEILSIFKLSKAWGSSGQVAILGNGDFALLHRISKSEIEIYYGNNRSTFRANYQFLIDMADDKLRIPKLKLKDENFFSWPLFVKLINPSYDHRDEEKDSSSSRDPLLSVPLTPTPAKTGVLFFKDLVLFHVQKYLSACPWAWSMIDKLKLFEPMPESSKLKNKYEEYLIANLFDAVAKCDVVEIDNLIKEEGIIFSNLIYDGKSLSEHAGDKWRNALAFSLIDNVMWNIFSKPELLAECERVKALKEVEQKLTKLWEIFSREIFSLGFDGDSSYNKTMDWKLFAELIFGQEDNSLWIAKFKGTPIHWIWKKYNENQSTISKQLNKQRWKRIWPKIDVEKLFEYISNIFPDNTSVLKRYTGQPQASTTKLNLTPASNDKLFSAVLKGDCRRIDDLVKMGVDLSIAKNENGQTLSQYALDNGQKFLELLVEDSLIWQLLKEDERRWEEQHNNVKLLIKNFSKERHTKSSSKKKARTPGNKSNKVF